MIIHTNRLKTYLFITACLFLKCLIVSSVAVASNEVLKISAEEGRDRTRILLFFKDRPSYTLYAVSESHILLTLNDTIRGAAFEKDLPDGNMFSLNEGQNQPALKFDINLQMPFSNIDSSWIEDKKLLYIEISSSSEPSAVIKTSQETAALQDIRFGFIENGTRMVMKVDNNPSWEIEFKTQSTLIMRLFNVSNALKKEKFGPVKRLKEVNIPKTEDKQADLSLVLEFPLTHVSIFRMAEESRLVLDILDEPGVVATEVPDIKSKTPAAAAATENKRQTKTVIEDKGNYLRVKISKSDPPAVVSVADNKTDSAGKIETNIIPVPETREKAEAGNIPSGGTTTGAEGMPAGEERTGRDDSTTEEVKAGTEKTAKVEPDSVVKIEPILDEILPMSSEMRKTIEGLTPEEAFLYGRVKQAMEIKDYEKGILLTNQFIDELPGSSLVEDMMFLKGDFYYSIWKNGDNEVLGNIVSSYQGAIDRFPESVYAPSGYIKMAQTQSVKGEDYLALGYLGIVLSQKKNTDLAPLAFLNRGKLGQYEKAIADFNAIMEQYGDSEYASEANFWIANYHHTVGQYEEAEKKLEDVLDMDPAIFIDHPEYLFLRAKNYLFLKDYDHAREYLFWAVNIGRQQEGADMLLTRIGDTYHNQENDKEAEKFYRMVIDYYSGTEGASISKLRIAGYSSDTSILDELSMIKGNDSISELALLEKGYRLYDKNEYAGAVDAIKQLIEKPVETETRKSARTLFHNAADREMARLYQTGKFKDMTDFYASIKDLLTGNMKTETMLNVALAFGRLNLNDEAIAAFQGIRLNELSLQSRGAYYTGFAESYLNNGNMAEARSLLEKARNYDLPPADQQRISRSLALLYIQDNMLDEAFMLCQSITGGEKLLSEEETADIYILTARILNLQKRYAESKTAINSLPGMPDGIKSDLARQAYMELGKACYNMGDYAGAAEAYESGFDLGYSMENNDYWNLRFNLAQAYANSGEDRKARTLFSEISEGGDSILQQRAQLQLGTMNLEKQLQRLPLGRN
jgi:TolA-binding protein